jgi:hypothetical protein
MKSITITENCKTLKRILLAVFIFGNNLTSLFAQNTGDTSIAMLNYLATETRMINTTKNNRLLLEETYNKLINNTNPGIIDVTTQDFLQIMLDDIESFRINNIQRDRLQYILENQRAQAISQAMPNPLYLLGLTGPGGLKTVMTSRSESMNLSGSLSGNLSGPIGNAFGHVAVNIYGSLAKSFTENITRTITNPMKLLATISIMTLDSVLKYKNTVDTANIDFIKDNWELDDRESATLHNLRSQTFSYMIDVARTNKLGLFDTLNEESIDNFVNYCMDDNLERRRQSFESNRLLYAKYAPYYLELAKTYYDLELYQDCINAVEDYERTRAPIFRKDYDLAGVLPKAIIAAAHIYEFDNRYVNATNKYLKELIDNTSSSNWELRYFAVQTYINLVSIESSNTNLASAYSLLLDNITFLSKQQEKYLAEYINPVNIKMSSGISKDQKKQIKKTIKELMALRKTEIPPLYESLVVNHQALLLLMDEMNISEQERQRVNTILNNAYVIPSFRQKYFNEAYTGEQKDIILKKESVDIGDFLNDIFAFFTKKSEWKSIKLILPVVFLASNSKIDIRIKIDETLSSGVVNDKRPVVLEDVTYTVKKVSRKRKEDIGQYVATLSIPLEKTLVENTLVFDKNLAYTLRLALTTHNVSSTLTFISPKGDSGFELISVE